MKSLKKLLFFVVLQPLVLMTSPVFATPTLINSDSTNQVILLDNIDLEVTSSGSIIYTGQAVSLSGISGINNINNAGTIAGNTEAIFINRNNLTVNITNSGILRSNNLSTYTNAITFGSPSGGTSGKLINSGTILGGSGSNFGWGLYVVKANLIELTNTGSILGGSGYQSIFNDTGGSITIFNNLQGGNTPVTLKGTLPVNYNVIISNDGTYGKLSVTSPNGETTFGISPMSGTLNALRYEDVISGVNLNNFTNTSGTYRGATWNLVEESDGFWDLVFLAPFSQDTSESMALNAFALRNAFNLQSAKIAQGLSYDCTVYDEKNICVSFAGTRSEGKDFDATTGALIMAHQPSKHFRLGAYVDQSYDASTSGGLTTKNGKPGFGVFGVWTQNTDGLGAQVRVSANMGKVGIETQREAVETAEAGFGKSNIESRGWQLEYSQGYAINSIWTARPYVGYRKTTHTRAAYTEQSSDDVTAPLTYGSVKQNTDTVTAGITFAHTEMAKTSMFLTAGVEHELRNRMDRYGASSSEIEGIGSIDLSTDKRKTHLALALTVNHDIDKTQRIGVSLNHRKEAFAPGAVTSAGVQYSKGF